MTTVGDAIAALEAAYPPRLAADWDAVGLVCGDPADPVSSVLIAVDPVPETVDEAVGAAQLLITHHPLLLRLPDGRGERVRHALRAAGIAVRRCDTFPGLGPDHLRVAVRPADAVARLVAALTAALADRAAA